MTRESFAATASRFDIPRDEAEHAMNEAERDGEYEGGWYAVTYADNAWQLYLG